MIILLYFVAGAFAIAIMWALSNLYIKNDTLEKEISNALDQLSSNDAQTIELLQLLHDEYAAALNKLKTVARNGSFETDDETGFIFNTILKTTEDLKLRMEILITQFNSNGEINE